MWKVDFRRYCFSPEHNVRHWASINFFYGEWCKTSSVGSFQDMLLFSTILFQNQYYSLLKSVTHLFVENRKKSAYENKVFWMVSCFSICTIFNNHFQFRFEITAKLCFLQAAKLSEKLGKVLYATLREKLSFRQWNQFRLSDSRKIYSCAARS